ncbi:hypothetical protein F5Y16DRAFT_97715 [Xylariaceae sp. FL0255]|nr:hypothetical protein F5Y16DRAFT_97715 [Xylariaceae sp. FL0255]
MDIKFDHDDSAVMDEDIKDAPPMGQHIGHGAPFLSKTRSLSDGNGSQLSPSPLIVEASRRTSKDDSSLGKDRASSIDTSAPPVTPRRPDFPIHGGGLSLQLAQQQSSPAQSSFFKQPAPSSPKLDPSQIYASPSNILPRRSRGLDFSRAATSLHHSTLAEQSSPDSSPTIGGRAMNIPGLVGREMSAEQSSTSLWSIMGNQERMHISSSVGSANPIVSDSSSSSGDDDMMDDEMEDAILSTPQVSKSHPAGQGHPPVPWIPGGSPTINSLSSFRTRPRKHPRRKTRGLASLGFNAASPAALSRSPPTGNMLKEMRDSPMSRPRRESISWAANQLHISSTDGEDRAMDTGEPMSTTPSRDGSRGVVKRPVTRRGNLLPKTKGFARIRAALLEESAPVDSEVRREAEVVRQVRESDMDLEPRVPTGGRPEPHLDLSGISTAQSSPKFANTQESLEEIPDDMMALSKFKQQAMRNSKGKSFWDSFSDTSSINGTRTTPPPPPLMLPRGSSSGISEDINMDSPSLSAGSGAISLFGPGGLGSFSQQGGAQSDSQRSDTPHQPSSSSTNTPSIPAIGGTSGNSIPPTAAEITRRIAKRRRDDDFDPHIFKRRAVSPGMSAHNSPIMQSPLQRDNMPWGSRPGSVHGGDGSGGNKASGTPSENGSSGGNNGTVGNGSGSGGPAGRQGSASKGRVGFQGMVDTNDGLMRMSIE